MNQSMRCNPFTQLVPDFKTLYIFGAGGFGREVAWLSAQLWGNSITNIFLVDEQFKSSESVDGVVVQSLSEIKTAAQARFVVALGDPVQRRGAAGRCMAIGLRPVFIVHPRAEISARVQLSEGVVICAGNAITTGVTLAAHVHINLNCTIGHDARIGEFSTLSPGVHVSGNVQIGNDVFIGTGANIISGTTAAPLVIGDGAVIAAGACVTRAVEPGAMVAGVPAVRKH